MHYFSNCLCGQKLLSHLSPSKSSPLVNGEMISSPVVHVNKENKV